MKLGGAGYIYDRPPLEGIVSFPYGNFAQFNPILPCLAQTTPEKYEGARKETLNSMRKHQKPYLAQTTPEQV